MSVLIKGIISFVIFLLFLLPVSCSDTEATVNEKIKTYYSTYNSAVSTKVSTPNEAFRAMLKLRTKVKSGVKVPEGG